MSKLADYPVPTELSRWRCHAYQHAPGAFIMGLQAPDGTWISLLGGRRHDGITRVYWQRNDARYKHLSVATAMRSALIQHEVSLGMSHLRFENGTSHSMHNAFVQDPVDDLLVSHRPFSPLFFRKVLPRVLPKGSVLAEVLNEAKFTWHSTKGS